MPQQPKFSNDEELGAFLPLEDIDATLHHAYEESVRSTPLYAAPIAATQYTQGDTSPVPLPPITDEVVHVLPSRISSMYVPHESENRHFTDAFTSPRLPDVEGGESDIFAYSSLSALSAHRRPTTMSELRTAQGDQAKVPTRRLSRQWEERSAAENFVPTAPNVAEMLEELGLKVPLEARLSDRRRYKNDGSARQNAPKTSVRDQASISSSSDPILLPRLGKTSGHTDSARVGVSSSLIRRIGNTQMPPSTARSEMHEVVEQIASGANNATASSSQKSTGAILRGSGVPVRVSNRVDNSRDELMRTGKLTIGTKSTEVKPSVIGSSQESVDANDAGAILRRAEQRLSRLQQSHQENTERTKEVEKDATASKRQAENLERALSDAESKMNAMSRKTPASDFTKAQTENSLPSGEFSPDGPLAPAVRRHVAKVVKEVTDKTRRDTTREVETRVTERVRTEIERDTRNHARDLAETLAKLQEEAQDRFLNS